MKKIAEISNCEECLHFRSTPHESDCNWGEKPRRIAAPTVRARVFPHWCPLKDVNTPPKCPVCGQAMKEKPLSPELAQTKHADKLSLWECDCISDAGVRLKEAEAERDTHYRDLTQLGMDHKVAKDRISELEVECSRLREATMKKGTDGPIISMQQLFNGGVNAFGLKLFVESVQEHVDKHGAFTFNFMGNIVHVCKEVKEPS